VWIDGSKQSKEKIEMVRREEQEENLGLIQFQEKSQHRHKGEFPDGKVPN
jgi:hypothetical protein